RRLALQTFADAERCEVRGLERMAAAAVGGRRGGAVRLGLAGQGKGQSAGQELQKARCHVLSLYFPRAWVSGGVPAAASLSKRANPVFSNHGQDLRPGDGSSLSRRINWSPRPFSAGASSWFINTVIAPLMAFFMRWSTMALLVGRSAGGTM